MRSPVVRTIMGKNKKPFTPKPGKRASVQVTIAKSNPFEVIYEINKKEGLEVAQEVLFEEGRRLAAKIRTNILQQLLDFTPLSEPYAAWKKKKGLDPRILIARGNYVKSIRARKLVDGNTDVNVPDETHPDAKISYRLLGQVHEFGQLQWQSTGKGIPARPHWRPTILWWQNKRQELTRLEIERRISEVVKKRLEHQLGEKKYTTK